MRKRAPIFRPKDATEINPLESIEHVILAGQHNTAKLVVRMAIQFGYPDL